jgi:DNA-binding transcriptional regulator GbsR (MarR family)
MPKSPAADPKNLPDLPELNDLAEQVGEFIAYWGFKKVHGRLWTHLFLSEHPLDAAEFIERLGISKALVSMTLSDLLQDQVILPAGKSPRGTDLFVANPDTSGVITNVLRTREKRMLSRIEAAFRLFKGLPAKDKKVWALSDSRQEELGTLIQGAQDAIEGFISLTSIDLKNWK